MYLKNCCTTTASLRVRSISKHGCCGWPSTAAGTELDENLPAPDVLEEDGSVLDAIRTLPENYRNAIYLHYYEGYTAAEIGRMMAVPTNTVLSWLRRARAQLHTMLKEEIEDEVV